MSEDIRRLEGQIANLAERVYHCGEGSVDSSSKGGDQEGLGGMEVKIADQMEDPPWELISVIEEDSDDIPILEENQDPIPVTNTQTHHSNQSCLSRDS